MKQSGVLTTEQSGILPTLDNGYLVNEVFYSVQGEGVLAGCPMVFVRFAKCNLRCTVANSGFDCDTEFEAGSETSLQELLTLIRMERGEAPPGWVLLTGGEPGLQTDDCLVTLLKSEGYRVAIETNGTCRLPEGIDWVCVSPKSAWHTIKVRKPHELKVVRNHGQPLPLISEIPVMPQHYVVSPAFLPDGRADRAALDWCIDLVKETPEWRLSIQTHKLLGVR